jgi:hypothetical protein
MLSLINAASSNKQTFACFSKSVVPSGLWHFCLQESSQDLESRFPSILAGSQSTPRCAEFFLQCSQCPPNCALLYCQETVSLFCGFFACKSDKQHVVSAWRHSCHRSAFVRSTYDLDQRFNDDPQ